jgi:hypothetical protein
MTGLCIPFAFGSIPRQIVAVLVDNSGPLPIPVRFGDFHDVRDDGLFAVLFDR